MALPNIQRIIEDKIGLNKFGIGLLRNVEWGKKYLWSVRFFDPAPPVPFDSWFPASDITVPEANLNSFNFDQGQGSFKAPQRTDIKEISLTFYDDSNQTLLTWMKSWIAIDIMNNGKYVSCLKDDHLPEGGASPYGYTRVYPVRTMEVTKLDESLEPIKGQTQIYSVYPEGNIEFQGGSASESNIYTINFTVVGEGGPKDLPDRDDEFLTQAKKIAVQTLGRFF